MKKRSLFLIIISSLLIISLLTACSSSSDSSSEPSFTTGTVKPLRYNEWVEGTLATSGSVQWFSFTATAATQYIHCDEGTFDAVKIQLYDGDGNAIGYYGYLSTYSPTKTYSSLTSGSTYFIKIT